MQLLAELGRSAHHARPPVAPATSPLPARIDEYQVLRPLGHGAMGQVLLARDTRLERSVAIKFISAYDPRVPDEAARERFLREARALARLTHPNVVAIYRIGEVEGRPFLVSEYVRGQGLHQLELPLPSARVLVIGLGLARGLAVAHRQGVLHRDIKPANAILSADGHVKLIDFGLAELLGLGAPASSAASAPPAAADPTTARDSQPLTFTGAVLGTPAYLAPERWRGEPATPQSDIYALGALLYELLCAQLPHRARSLPELQHRVLAHEAPPLCTAAPGCDSRLAEVIERCLRHDRSERYSDAEQLIHALRRLALDERSAAMPDSNPYRGLLPFEAEHDAVFFGRAAEVQAVLARLRRGAGVLVAGDSGVGKSSLCRAGVLAQVRAGALADGAAPTVVCVVPGRRPLAALAEALAEAGCGASEQLLQLLRARPEALRRRLAARPAGLVLFIDQLEELVTLSEPAEAQAVGELMDVILARPAQPGLRLLLAARVDYLTRLGAIAGLGPHLEPALLLLRPLSSEGLREAVVEPAAARGVRFEPPQMIEGLVAAGAGEGGLPLLQFALSELWEARDLARGVITASALDDIGGVSGALARHADGVLARLPAAGRLAARRLLLRLVTSADTRARRGAADLLSGDPAEPVALEALVRGRLLVASEGLAGPTYALAHEALVQGWPALRGFLAAEREGQVLRERLDDAAAEWERLGRGGVGLWGEAQLRESAALPATVALLPRTRSFLDASRRHAARRARVRRGVLTVLLALPLLLGLAALQTARAREARQRTAEITLERLAVQADSLAQLPGRESAALVAAIRAAAPALRQHQLPAPVAMEGLSAAVSAARRSLPLGERLAGVSSLALSSDGARLLSAGWGGAAYLWDWRSATLLATLTGGGPALRVARFSPDGARIVSGGDEGLARLWDARSGALLGVLRGHQGRVNSVAFSPDGARTLSASWDGTARLWDARSGALLGVLRGHRGPVHSAAFSPDGARVVTASEDGSVRRWDGRSGAPLDVLPGGLERAFSAAYSPDGRTILAVGMAEPGPRLWDAASGAPLAPLAGQAERRGREPFPFAAYSPSGRHLVASQAEGAARVWSLPSGAVVATLPGRPFRMEAAAFAADERSLLSASGSTSATLWDLQSGQRSATLDGHSDRVLTVALAADGEHALTGSKDGSLRRANLYPGQQLRSLIGHGGAVDAVAASPDGRRAATGSADQTARLWDLDRGAVLLTLPHPGWVTDVAFAPDGAALVTACADQSARVYDARSGALLAVLRGHQGGLFAARFTPDGTRVVSYGGDSAVRVFDWRAQREVLTLRAPSRKLALSPDGARLATTDGQLALWDLRSGALLARVKDTDGNVITGADFSADGRWLVTGGEEPRLRDAASGRALRGLRGHLGAAQEVAFAPDSARVVTVGQSDRTVRVWDAQGGQPLLILRQTAESAVFTPDGRHLLVASFPEPVAKLYPTTTAAVLGLACDLLRPQAASREVAGLCP